MNTPRRYLFALLGAATLLFVSSCQTSSSSPSAPSTPPLNVSSVAQEITNGVGLVKTTVTEGTKGPMFVFEEVHTSRLGQLQIAVMLLRLHDRYGLKKIALEGSIWSGNHLDGGWYQNSGTKQDREDSAVPMVAAGEISSSELMAILFPDVEVYGVEDASQYGQELKVKGNPEVGYLVSIAEKGLSSSDIQKVNLLVRPKKEKEALEYVLMSDPWTKQQYKSLRDSSNVSAEGTIERLRGIQAKARELGLQIRSQDAQEMENEIHFFETASQRSVTMVNNALQLPGAVTGAPEAMIIGAAHSGKVTELLKQRNVSFALIQPVDLKTEQGSMSGDDYERKTNGGWARNDAGSLGHVLNLHRKPPPVIGRIAGHSYASMQLAGILLAKSARTGGKFPDNVWGQLSALPDIRIDKNSITRDGYDVIFRAWLKQDDGREKEVWARLGSVSQLAGHGGGNGGNRDHGRKTSNDEPSDDKKNRQSDHREDSTSSETLERKLIDATEELKAENAGRKGVVKLGADVLAAFGSTRAEVIGTPHISS